MCGKDVKSQLQMVRFITVLHKTKVKNYSLVGVVLNTTTEATTVASHGNEEKLL